MSDNNPAAKKPAVWNKDPLPNVKRIIAVASGKGGVGKSTTAVNLALALKNLGKSIGILDADIHGPSIPTMLGLVPPSTLPPQAGGVDMKSPPPAGGSKGGNLRPEFRDGKMIPLENHGLKCMSISFITGDTAAILRGPMVSKALHQLLRSTAWGTEEAPLDFLIVDMPPGTGDIHLSMAQSAPLDGAIIVTTPQAVAVADARKCAVMFIKVGVPVLGVIENMSGELFGSGGGKNLAAEFSAPLLGEIPADSAIREASDGGKVYAGKCAGVYREIAEKIL